MEYIVLSYNARTPTLWTPFDGGILGCKKGVAFHDHPDPVPNSTPLSRRKNTPTAF